MNRQQKGQQNSGFLPSDVDESVEIDARTILKRMYHHLHKFSGVWYMIASNSIFTVGIFSIKLVPADMFDIMVIRFLLQAIVFGSYAKFYKGYKVFDTNGQPLASSMNFIMASLTNLLYLASYYFLPLADLNIVKHTYIIWSAILAVIFLKDRFSCMNAITLILALLGLFITTNSAWVLQNIYNIVGVSLDLSNNTVSLSSKSSFNTSPYYYFGILLASLSALTKAILVIARKQLVKTKQPYSVMNFHFTSSGLIMSVVYCIVRRIWHPEPFAWKWALIAGSIFGCIQVLTTTFFSKALKRENVQLLSIVGSMDIIYAVLLEYIFFQIKKPWIFFIGAGLVVLSATFLSIDHHLNTSRQAKDEKKQNIEETKKLDNV